MKIICVIGDHGCGKSTLSRSLSKSFNIPLLSFATGLRDELVDVLGVTREFVYQKPTPDFVRHLLIGYGFWKRQLDQDYWVDKLVEKIPEEGCIIDDMRFINEYYGLPVRPYVIYIKDPEHKSLDLQLLTTMYTSTKLYEVPQLILKSNLVLNRYSYNYEEILKRLC